MTEEATETEATAAASSIENPNENSKEDDEVPPKGEENTNDSSKQINNTSTPTTNSKEDDEVPPKREENTNDSIKQINNTDTPTTSKDEEEGEIITEPQLKDEPKIKSATEDKESPAALRGPVNLVEEDEKKTDTPTNATTAATTATTTPPTSHTIPVRTNAMDLNVAYEALEQVRQANVAIEFGRTLLPKECIPCLREKQRSSQAAAKMTSIDRSSRFKKFLAANKPANVRHAAPCLTCGTTVCPRHRCQALKKENINICTDCAVFFALDTYFARINHRKEDDDKTVDTAVNNNNTIPELSHTERKQHMNHMLDVYDRVLLILHFSSRFVLDIASALEHNTKRNNQIGLGSSATGMVSGVVGVAAAVTIFTPVGPPLLIASLLFGSGATAASAGSEAVNYHCSANKMCDTIIALHGMCNSMARTTLSNSEAVDGGEDTGGNCDTEVNGSNGTSLPPLQESASNGSMNGARTRSTHPRRDNNNNTTDTNDSTTVDEVKEASRRNWMRAAGNALKPLTGGALSAVSVVGEAREMRMTLEKMHAGNPCAKANSLREIGSEIADLPSTKQVAHACPKFFRL